MDRFICRKRADSIGGPPGGHPAPPLWPGDAIEPTPVYLCSGSRFSSSISAASTSSKRAEPSSDEVEGARASRLALSATAWEPPFIVPAGTTDGDGACEGPESAMVGRWRRRWEEKKAFERKECDGRPWQTSRRRRRSHQDQQHARHPRLIAPCRVQLDTAVRSTPWRPRR